MDFQHIHSFYAFCNDCILLSGDKNKATDLPKCTYLGAISFEMNCTCFQVSCFQVGLGSRCKTLESR